ncbi:sigma-54-dependent Fis family transcriptional regulator [Fusibacter sp. 3D3]|uniref:sigma-54 interaction domain-containing protein n=1 Tax=Fusibacter sp. 3D3 TaxID=1048380 RepID=UPI000853B486|nr:sigma 54-interacting transcriptional regulator [Fusibacter sp. 3D3]GAU76655.1 response regulator of zinc sigma-54-dependent two-component system [Fusibacter sp. 3D3]
MMKEIAVIAYEKEYALFIKACLEVYFGKYAKINAYSAFDIDRKRYVEEKYIVISAFTMFKKVHEKMRDSAIFQVVKFALSNQQLEYLKALPTDRKILLANIDYRNCMEVITQIYEAGFKELDITAYFGDEKSRDKSIRYAITPNELQMVPKGMETIINIGERVLDINSVIELADKMCIEGVFSSDEARRARNNVISTSRGIERLLGENEKMIDQIKALIELMEDGIILTDLMGRIYLANNTAKAMLRNQSEIIEGFAITDILPELKLNTDDKNHKKLESILSFGGENFIVQISTIFSEQTRRGNIVTLKNFDELEDKQHGIRSRIIGNKHVAKYIFEDIRGESEPIKEAIITGKRMAKSDASVFIMGESGTGKEVFSQSIHNMSNRKKYSFVAVNCSAIPDHLLESEMFGYEEGAFTGAKKGGKIGLFELAHKGTIFLDEIGEMPLSLQSKLLRVLEEKRVSRVGALKLIDIDVRVIAATNRNIKDLIREKKFREDLYYRLNVLPLDVPALRERKEDIPLLLEHFMNTMTRNWTYSDEVMRQLCDYQWPGNIRELRNVVEYLSSLEKAFIDAKDLPRYIFSESVHHEQRKKAAVRAHSYSGNLDFILREGRKIDLIEGILKTLNSSHNSKEKWGRVKIEETLASQGYAHTETEIRNGLRLLNEMGYIFSSRGRGGSKITEKGCALLGDLDQFKVRVENTSK